MDGCSAQWYPKVPGVVRVNEKEAPGPSVPLFQTPVVDVDVCATPSRFVQVTVSPTLTVMLFGAKAKPWIATPRVAAAGAASTVDVPSARSSAAPASSRSVRAVGEATIRTMRLASPPFAALALEAARFGLVVSDEQIAVCERYAEALIERNTSVNLTAITAPADIAHKHVLDSWTAFAVRRWSGRERVIDVGSGAGFPGLALRIARAGLRVTLVESVGKKARFLEEVAGLLGLADVEVRNERAEALAHTRRERYDVATARAVGTLGQSIEYLLPFLRVGGDAIVWKGRLEQELAGARKAAAAVGGDIAAIVSTADIGVGDVLPGRNLVVIRKIRPTPARYPRTSAEARRRPW